MSILARFVPNLATTFGQFGSQSSFIGNLYDISVRTVIRCNFPRPSETKRIKKFSWTARMATPAGRRILMNRILKGRHVYAHCK